MRARRAGSEPRSGGVREMWSATLGDGGGSVQGMGSAWSGTNSFLAACARMRTACVPQVGPSRFAVALCGQVGHHCRQRSWSPPSQCARVSFPLVAPSGLPRDSSPATRLHSTPTTRRAIAPLLRVPSRPCLAQSPLTSWHHGTMTPLRCYVPSTTWLRGPRSPSWPGIVFGPFSTTQSVALSPPHPQTQPLSTSPSRGDVISGLLPSHSWPSPLHFWP